MINLEELVIFRPYAIVVAMMSLPPPVAPVRLLAEIAILLIEQYLFDDMVLAIEAERRRTAHLALTSMSLPKKRLGEECQSLNALLM